MTRRVLLLFGSLGLGTPGLLRAGPHGPASLVLHAWSGPRVLVGLDDGSDSSALGIDPAARVRWRPNAGATMLPDEPSGTPRARSAIVRPLLEPAETMPRLRSLDRERSVAPAGYNRWLIPPAALAYLRDLFGTLYLGTIHGRLSTSWSVTALLGPQLVNSLSTFRIERGTPRAEANNLTMDLMAGLLLVGLACNLLVRPVEGRLPSRTLDTPLDEG